MQDAFSSSEMAQLRTQLLNGEKPDVCHICWQKEDLGMPSYRQAYNRRAGFVELLDIDNPELKYVDIKFDNNCNLQCSYCDISSSNQFERARAYFDAHGLEHPNNLDAKSDHYSTQKRNYILDIAPSLRVLKVTGGEPLLSKDFVFVVDYLLEHNLAQNIELNITTNATLFNTVLLDKFNQFKRVTVTISVDSVGPLYDYIRYPYNWNKFNQRIHELLNYTAHNRKFKLKFAAIVTCYSLYDNVNMFEWIRELEITHGLQPGTLLQHSDFNVGIHPIDHPLSILALPESMLAPARELVLNYKHAHLLENTVIPVFTNLKTDPNVKPRISLGRFTHLYDRQRGTDYSAVLDPRIIDYINEE